MNIPRVVAALSFGVFLVVMAHKSALGDTAGLDAANAPSDGMSGPATATDTDTVVRAGEGELPAPYQIEATATDLTKFLPAAGTVVSTAPAQKAEPLPFKVRGICTDTATGVTEVWNASVAMSGENFDGSAVLSGEGGDVAIALGSGNADGRVFSVSLVGQNGELGMFSGTVEGSTVTGQYITDERRGICSGDLVVR
jgi:hypothetical protein